MRFWIYYSLVFLLLEVGFLVHYIEHRNMGRALYHGAVGTLWAIFLVINVKRLKVEK